MLGEIIPRDVIKTFAHVLVSVFESRLKQGGINVLRKVSSACFDEIWDVAGNTGGASKKGSPASEEQDNQTCAQQYWPKPSRAFKSS